MTVKLVSKPVHPDRLFAVLYFGRTIQEFASMNIITTWLQGSKPYMTGVKLLLAHTDDKLLVKLFTTEGETPFKRKKLEESLKAIISGSSENSPINEQIVPFLSPSAQSQVKLWPENEGENEALIALRSKWLEIFKTMQDLRSQLLLLPTKEQRCETAFEILRLDRQCRDMYADREYFKTNGHLPYRKPIKWVIDPVHMGTRIQTLRRYIRREATKLKKNPTAAETADRRQGFIEELNHYLTQLGKPLYADQL